jgi:hypothetical protein
MRAYYIKARWYFRLAFQKDISRPGKQTVELQFIKECRRAAIAYRYSGLALNAATFQALKAQSKSAPSPAAL